MILIYCPLDFYFLLISVYLLFSRTVLGYLLNMCHFVYANFSPSQVSFFSLFFWFGGRYRENLYTNKINTLTRKKSKKNKTALFFNTIFMRFSIIKLFFCVNHTWLLLTSQVKAVNKWHLQLINFLQKREIK